METTLVSATESSWCMNGYDESGNLDFSKIDGALLTSLLDDVVEDYDDDERLRGVIQSLEAEITVEGGSNNCQPSDAGQIDGQDNVLEFNGLDLRMMDIGVDMEMEHSFPATNDGINYWYHCDDHHEMDGVDEYCSRGHFEDITSGYGFLWQETNASSALKQG